MSYTNSSLVSYTKISPNRTSPRNHVIDTITIHCMAGNLSVEGCGNVFAPTARQASSNYGIGSDGRIALYVNESDRSWCSSDRANDHRAVTIEVANDGGAPDWHVSDKAMASLIELVADICKRNHIRKLVWSTDKNDRVNHLNGCNMTVHRDFAAKACPGNYLYGMHPYIADEVNKKLGNDTTSGAYQVKLLEDLNIRKFPNGTIVKVNGAKKGIIYTIVETVGNWGRLKSGAGWISVSDKYVRKV
ncbi:MAG: N-acetylmuramoyl-L-alanine amidase [Lachnoclostridium sp.]|nr:N-acetylmuramoyl-L-alanine amidase [Lachnospira sp.]MCM1249258.1 N-acetylmuramoyl-L-alanine amidase [Lachnoclostridium sp.]MCM1536399.1 N-acetylmuramoyl-L-alanine amidase [Clostridium sp.]